MIDHGDTNKQATKSENPLRAELRVVSDRVSESFCSVLKKAREKKGLSQKDIAESLRIPLSTIIALEEQRYDKLPQDTYTKGYIRSYAAILGLNPEGLVKDFQQDKEFRELNEKDRLVAENRLRQEALSEKEPALDQMLQGIASNIAVYKRSYGKSLLLMGLALVVFGFFVFDFFSERLTDEIETIETIETIENVKVQSVDGSVVVSNLMDTEVSTPIINQFPVSEKSDYIKIMFSGTTWVTIRDSEKGLVHQSRKQKGEVLDLEVTNQGPYFIKLSKASAANLYLNEKIIDFSSQISDDDQLHEFTLNP